MLHLIGQHLRYVLDDNGYPDGHRCAELFRRAFVDGRWPDSFLADIANYWARGPAGSPRIELANLDRVLVDGQYVWAFGTVDQRGHRIQFSGRLMHKMPDHVIVDLVAHELLHCLEHAGDFAGQANPAREVFVDRILRTLGFDPQACQTWFDGYRTPAAEWDRLQRIPGGRYWQPSALGHLAMTA